MGENIGKLSKIRQPSRLSERVAAALLDNIRTGVLQEGEKLPSEAELSIHYGVSRTVVREALARLKYEGVLESKTGLGAFVIMNQKRRAFRLDAVGESLIDLQQVYELRASLEGHNAYLAAIRRTDAHLENLRRCLDAMAESIRDRSDGTAPDSEFHHTIAKASLNPYMADLMVFLDDKLRKVIYKARQNSSFKPGVPELVQEEHEDIYRKILARDTEGARDAAVNHLTRAASRLGFSIFGSV